MEQPTTEPTLEEPKFTEPVIPEAKKIPVKHLNATQLRSIAAQTVLNSWQYNLEQLKAKNPTIQTCEDTEQLTILIASALAAFYSQNLAVCQEFQVVLSDLWNVAIKAFND